jgi:transposase
VIVGVDPHEKSVTIEAVDGQGKKVATGRFGTSTRDYKAMLGYVRRQWPHDRWAIEGAHGVGRPLAQRLLADNERVVDVLAKLAARVRVFDTRDARKTDARLKILTKELKTAIQAWGSHLMELHGIGPAGGARILADVGDVARFPDRNHFASWTGTAPLDASSGEQIRHRLSRAGNRRLNHVLHMAAIAQIRLDTEGRTY